MLDTLTPEKTPSMIETKDLPKPADRYRIRRALLSVFDKTGIVEFASALHAMDVELVSTGGTARTLRDANLPVVDVSSLTYFPEILGGRVKTLHPRVHGGLLARRTDQADERELRSNGIQPIDMVVTNLYPFSTATAAANVSDEVAIENIDIGGPTMIRAAAKNFFFVSVVTNPADYPEVIRQLQENGCSLDMDTRRQLAHAAFASTAKYDRAIDAYFGRKAQGSTNSFEYHAPLATPLRYGENPHQTGNLFGDPSKYYQKLHGKDLSFNNLLDLSSAIRLIDEFGTEEPTCAILKHTNPCGVGRAPTLAAAYHKAFATDRQSPFGGIVVVNRSLDMETAEAINEVFTELIIAPEFDEGVLEFLQKKKNRRLIKRTGAIDRADDIRSVVGGLLVQDANPLLPDPAGLRVECTVATKRSPTEAEWKDLDFAWRVAKHVKSNAIIYVRDEATVGVGAGQMSRIDSAEIAASKSRKSELNLEGSVVASDAFFPFADGMLAAAEMGATAVIQPGGSVRDGEVIAAADDRGLAMVFTGKRHFRH